MTKKRCKICNKRFMQNSNIQKYCSEQCARQANIDKAIKHNKKYPKKLAIAMRKTHYRRKYGITIIDYNKLFRQQNGRCAICKMHQLEFNKHFDVDHNHKTNKIRGLVCMVCNRLIGKFENKRMKNKKLIKKIKNYLAKSK